MQVVQAPQNADSSDEEHEADEEEEPDADDSEILADLPDDVEVCMCLRILPPPPPLLPSPSVPLRGGVAIALC